MSDTTIRLIKPITSFPSQNVARNAGGGVSNWEGLTGWVTWGDPSCPTNTKTWETQQESTLGAYWKRRSRCLPLLNNLCTLTTTGKGNVNGTATWAPDDDSKSSNTGKLRYYCTYNTGDFKNIEQVDAYMTASGKDTNDPDYTKLMKRVCARTETTPNNCYNPYFGVCSYFEKSNDNTRTRCQAWRDVLGWDNPNVNEAYATYCSDKKTIIFPVFGDTLLLSNTFSKSGNLG